MDKKMCNCGRPSYFNIPTGKISPDGKEMTIDLCEICMTATDERVVGRNEE